MDLFIAHRRKLMEYANGIVGDPGRAEDIVQEAFLRFRMAAAERLLEEPVGFLYRVVRNLALDRRRRLRLEDRHMVGDAGDAAGDIAASQATPEQAAIGRQALQQVMDAMADLPERTRIALEMHRFGGCTLKEIADHLGISPSLAQRLVAEGIRHCQRAL